MAPRCREEFEQTMSGLGDRFPCVRWVGTHRIESSPPLGWIELDLHGGAQAGKAAAPVIGIRTGFAADEWDLVFGVATWVKQCASGRGPVVRAGGGQRCPRHGAVKNRVAATVIQWTPVARRQAVPPPAGPKEFTYVVAVPPDMRGRAERPSRPHVRIDLARSRGSEIIVRAPLAGARRAALAGRLAQLASALGTTITLEKPVRAAGSARRWHLAFPAEPDACAYDSIAAVDRVIAVLDAVLSVWGGTIAGRGRLTE